MLHTAPFRCKGVTYDWRGHAIVARPRDRKHIVPVSRYRSSDLRDQLDPEYNSRGRAVMGNPRDTPRSLCGS